jgi:hypothetical protein
MWQTNTGNIAHCQQWLTTANLTTRKDQSAKDHQGCVEFLSFESDRGVVLTTKTLAEAGKGPSAYFD